VSSGEREEEAWRGGRGGFYRGYPGVRVWSLSWLAVLSRSVIEMLRRRGDVEQFEEEPEETFALNAGVLEL